LCESCEPPSDDECAPDVVVVMPSIIGWRSNRDPALTWNIIMLPHAESSSMGGMKKA
jgi:hypothetical protein